MDFEIPRRPRTGLRTPRRCMTELQRLFMTEFQIPGPRTILARNFSMFTTHNEVVTHFERYGFVEKVSFKSRKDLLNTFYCKVRMRNAEDVDKIMNVATHTINDFAMKVEIYKGSGNHTDIYERGYYKLQLEGIPVPEDGNGIPMYERLEKICKDKAAPHCGISLQRVNKMNDETDIFDKSYNGVAYMRFRELLFKLRVTLEAEKQGYIVSTPPKRKKVLY